MESYQDFIQQLERERIEEQLQEDRGTVVQNSGVGSSSLPQASWNNYQQHQQQQPERLQFQSQLPVPQSSSIPTGSYFEVEPQINRNSNSFHETSNFIQPIQSNRVQEFHSNPHPHVPPPPVVPLSTSQSQSIRFPFPQDQLQEQSQFKYTQDQPHFTQQNHYYKQTQHHHQPQQLEQDPEAWNPDLPSHQPPQPPSFQNSISNAIPTSASSSSSSSPIQFMNAASSFIPASSHYSDHPRETSENSTQAAASDLPQTFSQEEDHPQPPNLELTPARLKTQVKQKQVSEAADGGGGGAGNQEEGPASKKKKKTTRRQGVTCDSCRTRHFKCDLLERKEAITGVADDPEAPRGAKTLKQEFEGITCSRCSSKNVPCTKDLPPAQRNYLRPGRSGKRIEEARAMHGTATGASSVASQVGNHQFLDPAAQLVFPGKTAGEGKLSSSVDGGWLAVHLCTTFFRSAHTQMPIIDADNFSKRFNHANGNLKIMVVMANGGDEEFESAVPSAPGLRLDSQMSTISTIQTLETLIAAMQCAAAHYTDSPNVFGPGSSQYLKKRSVSPTSSSTKPARRKQGGTCDPCRIRRVKCDYWERGGRGCSRCETKNVRCSDTFIQKRLAKERGGSSASSSSADTSKGEGPTAHFIERDYEPENMLMLGKLRKPFCHQLLTRALDLVEKHDILIKPSVEAVQALMILSPVLAASDDLQRSREFAAAACSHLQDLNLRSNFVVDERDPRSVQNLLSQIHAQRLANATWCFDSFWTCVYRILPFLKEDEPVKFVNRPPTVEGGCAAFTAPLKLDSPALSVYGDSAAGFVASRLAPIQSCSLSRYIAKNIDVVFSTSITDTPPDLRFPGTFSLVELQRLSASCHHVWTRVSELIDFSNLSVSRALKGDHKFFESNPVLPISWAATTQISYVSLLLAVYRVLGERLRVLGTSVQTRAGRARQGLGHPPSFEEMEALKQLKILFEVGKTRCLLACRRTAHLTAWLLPKQVFNTGYVRRQLVPISQFLASAPIQGLIQTSSPPANSSLVSSGMVASSLSSSGPNSPSQQDLGNGFVKPDDQNSALKHLKKPNEELDPWTQETKKMEVGWVIEGVKALGYAWSDCEGHVRTAEYLLQKSLAQESQQQVDNQAQGSR